MRPMTGPEQRIVAYMRQRNPDAYLFYHDVARHGSPAALQRLIRRGIVETSFTGLDKWFPQVRLVPSLDSTP